jgi:hypothetical protein
LYALLADPLAVFGIFMLGAAAGALVTYAKQKHIVGECRTALELASEPGKATAESPFGMKALVVGRDPEMISIFSHLFRENSIEIKTCFLESVAIDQLSSEKFEAIVLDFDHVGGCADILKSLPRPNKDVVVVAIASDSRVKEIASALGVTFSIERPLVPSQIRDLLRSGYGRMLHDRQAYFRLAVELPVSIRRASGDLLECTAINLSQRGMAVRTPHPLEVGERLSIAFAVPNTDLFVSAEGAVIWDNRDGKSGIHYEYTNSSVQARFFEWIHDQFFTRFERMQTELSLAHDIQATLVPTLSFQTPRFEVYGKSIASTEMGGDLIDVVESDGSLLAYVADISGHGLPAGQLMGILKAALRVSLQFHQRPVALLEGADRVLPALKTPDMYATLALLHFDCSAEAEYALAGHLPILHYRHRSRDTVRLAMEQLPLGLILGGRYASQRVSYSPGDVFLMLTDGITEVASERDEEFGLARLEQLLSQESAQPLSRIWELVMDGVKQHGLQQDDQSLLLLRVREPTSGNTNGNSCQERYS